MAMRIIDTEDKILVGDNHPQLKIGNKLYLVDDRKSTWDKIQKVQNDDALDDDKKQLKILELALGKENAEELLGKEDLTVSGYTALSFFVMAAITGEDYNELRERAEAERKN